MAAVFSREQIGIKRTGNSCTVPENNKAKLMYYLDCIACVLQLDNSPVLRRLRNYSNYASLTEEETDTLLILVTLISPDELIGKVIFLNEDLSGSRNQFFELSQVSHTFAVSDSILIGGERRRVTKIMMFKRDWLKENFLDPYMSFQARLERIGRGQPPPSQPPPSRPLPRRQKKGNCSIL